MRHPNERAFSLIEVTLALGVIGFCLVAMFSLFDVGLNASRQSNKDTMLAALSATMANDIAGQPNFDFSKSYYFDFQGIPLTSSTGALFACHITKNGVTELTNVSPRLTRALLTFTWPQPTSVYTQVFHVTIPPQ